MSLVTHVRKMARNNAWSNYRLHEACARLSPEEFRAERTSFFPSLEATLNHILAVDHYYIDALEGGGRGPAAFFDFRPFAEIGALRVAQGESDRRLMAFCDAQTVDSLRRTVITDRGKAGRIEETVSDLLAHLFVHQIHHRGQAHAMLSGTSVKPPQLDEYFLVFDREVRAADLAALELEGPENVR
jgi:uncharacterized damage-inducible protein DinB